ncbi:uncharacterized protein LOC122860800 isoform X2 [Aphidius gifuensis]|uniref:uncharacterized protein LOC122860800 isoform X2 n=1 Tax=Aphidius gifuensis TaxID=684658 RepID=UPI001CDCCF02|nr:uncharacterized protein LOC122860800 isoform X2 [Aphidius gifuensis]
MGERKRERSSKRRRPFYRGQQSCSDSEVARERLKETKAKSRDQLSWPIEVLTVDELARYRRRRVQKRPDTLGTDRHDDDGHSNRKLVTEYRRAFRATSEDSLIKKNETIDVGREFRNVGIDVGLMETDIEAPVIPGQVPSRTEIIKRNNNLKDDRNIYQETEYSKYKNHTGLHRPDLLRRGTSLKMVGDMQTVTEQCEKFIEWFNVSRPEIVRVPTNLKLEGQLETSTENNDNYVPFIGARRPELLRQSANLKLEGETTYLPEYTDVFRQPNNQDPRGSVPIDELSNLNVDNDKNIDNEKHDNKEENMKFIVSKLEDLKGLPLGIPEYKDSYKNFPRERPKLLKPTDEIGRSDGSKINKLHNPIRYTKKIDNDPEYKSKYIENDNRKNSISSRRASTVSSTYGKPFLVPDMRNLQSTSEVRSQYIPYGQIPRVKKYKMQTNIQTEGDMILKPEYRDAYCTRNDNETALSRYKQRERSLSISKRDNNNWINNDVSEKFGMINAEHEQNAFQILKTKIHDDGNITGKPPTLGGRRGSRASDTRRLSNIDIKRRTSIKNRSSSPTYRLHVCNVDDETRGGFLHRRRSSSVKYPINNTSTDVNNDDDDDDNQRSYSPSFGKDRVDDQQAFVVLDNSQNSNGRLGRRRSTRNSIIDINDNRGKIKINNKTPAGWMPPWYDNTNKI